MDSGIGCDSPAPSRNADRRRRLTVTDKCSDIIAELRGTVSRLQGLWDQVDMPEELRVSRLNSAFELISNLQSDMIESESDMVRGVHDNIAKGLEKINLLRERLKMEPWTTDRAKDGSLRFRNQVEDEVERLNREYEERRKDQAEVFEKLSRVAFRTGVDINGLIPESKQLLHPSDLGVLVARSNELCHVLNGRVSEVQKWQEQVRGLLRRMGIESLGTEVADVMLASDVTHEDFVLAPAIMETFEKDVVEVANKRFEEWLATLQFSYDEKIIALHELWNKCCVPKEDQHFESEFNPDKHTQTDIAEMERERQKLDSLYSARKNVYDRVAQWSELWSEKIGYEDISQKDAYTNRGCELERRLKRTRELENRLLPQAVRAVQEAYARHVQACPTDKMEMGGGMNPVQFIEWTKKTHEEEKALEKMMKKGAKHMPPPMRTPIRGNRLTQTPASMSRSGLNTRPLSQLDTTSLSVISPRFPNSPGPKTSSPKSSKRRGNMQPGCPTPLKKAFSSVAMSPMRPSNRNI